MEQRNKRLEVAKTFIKKREECLERITSEEGWFPSLFNCITTGHEARLPGERDPDDG